MRLICKTVLATVLLSASSLSQAGLLTIDINNNGGLSESQFSVFDRAVGNWGQLLTGIQSSFDLFLTIDASGSDIDGQGGVLGRAGPTTATVDNELGYAYAKTGVMEFDTSDLNSLESEGRLFDVIFHEIGPCYWLWNALGYGFAREAV